jgi:hypothetical protein
MLTSGLFTVHEVIVEAKVGDTFKLIPFGDVHRDAPSFAHEEWKEFLTYAKAQKKALFLGMGDYQDCASTSERTIISDERLHESTKEILHNHASGVVKTLGKELSFMRGKLLGLIGGNHYFAFNNGETSDHALCHELGTKFLGVCSLIRLTFRCGGGTGRRSVSFDIAANHGRGGGVTPGGSFNSVDKMQNIFEADCFLMGHNHGRGVLPAAPRLRLTQGGGVLSVKERTPILVRTGSFLKAYEPGMQNYNVDVCRPLCSLGFVEIDLTLERVRDGGEDAMKIKVRSTT